MSQKKAQAVMMLLALLTGVSVIAGMVAAVQAAEEYPKKPITYNVFWPPGGRSDIVARMISPFIEKQLGTPVVVNNNVGGAGVIGHKEVREAKPDGYMLAQSGTTVMFQYTKPGISLADYTWVANIYSAPFVIVVPSGSPFKSLKELVEFAKANPKKLRHGNSGTGSTTHLGSEGFGTKAGVEFTQIAYKGEGPAVIGVASAEVDLAFGPMVAFKQMIEAGKLRSLAVCAANRSKQHPDLPTCKELGYEFGWDAWEAIFGPKGLQENKAVWPKLSEGIKKAILDPELGQKLLSIGLEVQYRTGAELENWLKQNDQETKKIIYDLGLQYKP
ncbi:MAG: tripartite tricarboxylate transporter substrate binding protein [Desulfobacterota bacterium]|nr:tripartite tricarboxylate transporter substrate binding protein [Thermodesulfobacteriota bacterium]